MKPRGFVFWIVLFVAGSVLWLSPRPWAEVMGRLVICVAVFFGIPAPNWRSDDRFRKPPAMFGLHFVNILPMFVLGWLPSRTSGQTVVYLGAAAAVLAANTYVALAGRREAAA